MSIPMSDFRAGMAAGSTLSVFEKRKRLGTGFLYLFIIALVCIDASLFRIDERRINYPFLVTALLLLLPLTANGLSALRNFQTPKIVIFPLFLYVSYCFITVIWSVSRTDTIFHTLVFGIGIITCLGAVRFRSEDTLRIFVTISGLIFALSWMALVLAPGYALQQKGFWRLRGVMNHEFELGFLAAATLVILAVQWVSATTKEQSRRLGVQFYGMAALAAATLLATQTRTLMIYTLIVLLIIGVFYSRGNRRIFVLVAGGLFALVCALFFQEIITAFSRGDGDASLSGRTLIWERTLALADQVPWFGYGFSTFTDPAFDYVWYRYRPPHAHNTWIMAYFETGRIGAILLTLFMLGQLYAGFALSKKMKRPSVGFFLAVLCTVSGLTSLLYGGKLSALICLTFLVLVQEYSETFPKRRSAPQRVRPAHGRTAVLPRSTPSSV